MTVKGTLRNMNQDDIIACNGNERNQARLIVRGRGGEEVVFFADGQIRYASLDSQQGEDVRYELLA